MSSWICWNESWQKVSLDFVYFGKPLNTALARYMIIANRALRASPPNAPARPDVTDALPCRLDSAELTSSRHLLVSFYLTLVHFTSDETRFLSGEHLHARGSRDPAAEASRHGPVAMLVRQAQNVS